MEKDPIAHRTLLLRAIFRSFPNGKVPNCYYQYVRGRITRDSFLTHPDIANAAAHASKEARCAELGVTPTKQVNAWISEALKGHTDWVLIGGPPCQAYSLAGRSRLRSKDRQKFEADSKHFLYKEYLRIIQEFAPAIFVMENVKGMLNSTNSGKRIFERILADLKTPCDGLTYEVRSLVVHKENGELGPNDYVIEADDHGIPQSRHRVILFGIRSDLAASTPALTDSPERFLLAKVKEKVSVTQALAGLPQLRSRVSKESDSQEAWMAVLRSAPLMLKGWRLPLRNSIEASMAKSIKTAARQHTFGAAYIPAEVKSGETMPRPLRKWYLDARLGGVLHHESRSHMRSDLHRYLFAACFAVTQKRSPDLYDFPPKLLPVEGKVIEMVSEPVESGLTQKVKHTAYPTQEWGGFVWAYMGPQDAVPAFRPPVWAPTKDTRVSVAKVIVPCNWAQVLEGAIDSAHSSSLHSSDMVPARVGGAEATDKAWLRPSTDKAPRLQVERASYGFRYAALRRPITNAGSTDYVRSTVFVAPATALIPPNNKYNVANINVPRDDESTAFYFIAWGHPHNTPDTETWRKFLGQRVGVDLDNLYRPLRTLDNNFWQDRNAMKAGNFTGIVGFPNQDIAMWVTMGTIADRMNDRLGASDLAIVEFRKQMVDAVRSFVAGGPAIGTGELAVPAKVCSFQAIVPKSVDWRSYEVKPVWETPGPVLEPSYDV